MVSLDKEPMAIKFHTLRIFIEYFATHVPASTVSSVFSLDFLSSLLPSLFVLHIDDKSCYSSVHRSIDYSDLGTEM